MTDTGPDTILLDLFRTNQVRERLIEASLDGLELPPEDYPFYVLIGAEGPWTPTLLAERMKMPLSTVLFRVGRLDQRGHIERVPNPDDKRSYLIAYHDCCGASACSQCHCNNVERATPAYRPQGNGDIVWCFGGSSMAYHCSTAVLVGVAS